MKDKKKIIIGTLCALIMIMAVGYALLSQQLSINGSASITSNWQVEITNIRELEKSTGTTTNNTNYTATTASFNTSLTSPGDYALYEVTVTNKGTLDAVLAAKPTVTTDNNEAIIYELEGIKKGDKILKNNQTDTFTIKVTYNPSTTTQPSVLTSDIEVTVTYQQDLGQVVIYDYEIGDEIQFSGSSWRVIKNSPKKEDYIVLMKETLLTAQEITEDYSTTNSRGRRQAKMAYFWNDACHYTGYYGRTNYTSVTKSAPGCAHNQYTSSKIKTFLESYYLSTIDSNKLKKVDGYKIRLITANELNQNLGCSQNDCQGSLYGTWLFQNCASAYWTMTEYADTTDRVILLNNNGVIVNYDVASNGGVRPVINLLKSAIE